MMALLGKDRSQRLATVHYSAQVRQGDELVGDSRVGVIRTGSTAIWGEQKHELDPDDAYRVGWVADDFPRIPLADVPHQAVAIHPTDDGLDLTVRYGPQSPFTTRVNGRRLEHPEDPYTRLFVTMRGVHSVVIELQHKATGGSEARALVLTITPRTVEATSQRLLSEPHARDAMDAARALVREAWWLDARERDLKWAQVLADVCATVPYFNSTDEAATREVRQAVTRRHTSGRRSEAAQYIAKSLYERYDKGDEQWMDALRLLDLENFYVVEHPVHGMVHKESAEWSELFALARALLSSQVVQLTDVPSRAEVLGVSP